MPYMASYATLQQYICEFEQVKDQYMVEEDSPQNIQGMKTTNKQPNEVKTGRVQNARQIRVNNCVFFFSLGDRKTFFFGVKKTSCTFEGTKQI